MDKSGRLIGYALLAAISCFLLTACTGNQSGEISIENAHLLISFDRNTGALMEFTDKTNSHAFLAESATACTIWEVERSGDTGIEKITMPSASEFSFSKPDPLTIILSWNNFRDIANANFSITAEVRLDAQKALSYWKLRIHGKEGSEIHRVVFPRVSGIKDIGNEQMATPLWMGEKIQNPRDHLAQYKSTVKKYEWDYPGQLSVQCMTLYNPDRCGFYVACNDTLAYRKSFAFTLDTLNLLTYQMNNFPPLDSILTSFDLPYQAVLGSFKGDWYTAAELYRDWASAQSWCRESRLRNHLNPEWLEKTGLWIWNRGKSDNVIPAAMDLQQRSGLPVNVFWHWWHGCSYDVGFPEYFPPREGKTSFISAMSSAHAQNIHAIVYMNVLQWGNSTDSWTEEHASEFAVKDINGKLRSHVYNKFTGKSLTNMCIATDFWKDKYASLSDSAIHTYTTDGIYMDQACLSRMCYDNSHGHAIGGGNYWVENFGLLASKIRSNTPRGDQVVLAGEGGGETWLPHLNAFLTLQVSKERYSGTGSWEPIPFFQAVYHQYGVSYGNYSSLLTPPYDELWPKKFAPEDSEQLLDEQFNKQFLMEQARSFVWGMQPTIANYQSFLASDRKEEIEYLIDLARVRYKGLKYLLYGKYLRSPDMVIPEEEILISKLSIYAGRTGERVTTYKDTYPIIHTGTWQAEDKHTGITIASISDEPFAVDLNFNADAYDLPPNGKIYLTNTKEHMFLSTYSDGNIRVDFELPPLGICLIEIIPEIL